MKKEEVKVILEFLSDEKKIASILPKISKDAPKLYEDFWDNALDMYSSISEEYKDKMAEVISNALKMM